MPVILRLAREAEVWGAARFSDPALKVELEAAGVRTFVWDMVEGSLEGLPDDFTHVLDTALINPSMSRDFEWLVDVSCRAIARLMTHCRRARAFTHLSSVAVYGRLEIGHLYKETDPIWGLSSATFAPTYAAIKIASEAAVHTLAHALQLPSTIARVNMQYAGGPGTSQSGARAGVPGQYYEAIRAGRPISVRPNGDDISSLIHIDDLVRQAPMLWDIARVPATLVNWGGDDAVSAREVAKYIGELAGLPVNFMESDGATGMIPNDPTRRQSLIGRCEVNWRDGLARMVAELKAAEEETKGRTP